MDAKFCRSCGTKLPQVSDIPSSVPPDLAYAATEDYAGFWRRFGAYIIDSLLINISGYVLALIFGFIFLAGGIGEGAFLVIYLILFVAQLLYFPLMESSSKQATVGKMTLGIKVTDESGQRISFGRAIGRYFAKIISGLILFIGYIMVAFTKKKQGLHDMMAGTLVLKK